MNLFRRNSGLMLKTFLYQVVMSLFGFMMYSSTYRIPFLLVIGQITVIIFFFYIMGSQTFQAGAKSCEYDIGHNTSSSPFAGFLFALISFSPTIILAIISIICPPFIQSDVPNTAGYLSYTCNHVFLQGMYVGITQTLFPTAAGGAADALAAANAAAINSRCLIHLFGAIPALLASGIGYWIGYRGFSKSKKK